MKFPTDNRTLAMTPEYLEDSFLPRVAKYTKRDVVTGCLVWTGRIVNGYARLGAQDQMDVTVHRALYILKRGPFGDLDLDHKCRNRACVEIEHLEPVEHVVNVKRGKTNAPEVIAKSNLSRRANYEKNGHPLIGRVLSAEHKAKLAARQREVIQRDGHAPTKKRGK